MQQTSLLLPYTRTCQLKTYFISLHFTYNKCHICFDMRVALAVLFATCILSILKVVCGFMGYIYHLIIIADLLTTVMVALSLPIGLVTVHVYVPLSLVVTLSME